VSLPTITFQDPQGELPYIDDDCQHTREFAAEWSIKLSERWNGRVALAGKPLLLLESDDGITWVLPQTLSKRKDRELRETVKSPVGILTAVLTDSQGEPVQGTQKKLEVGPQNITDSELQALLEDIGLLALSTSTYLQAQLRQPIREGAGTDTFTGKTPVACYFESAEALIGLAETVKQSWPLVCQRPLSTIEMEVGVQRKFHPASPQSIIDAKIKPAHKARLGLVRISTGDCSENRFLCYVLDRFMILLGTFYVNLLNTLAAEFEEEAKDRKDREGSRDNEGELAPFPQTTQNKAEDKRKEAGEESQRLQGQAKQMAGRLEQYIEWARHARAAVFLRDVITPENLPPPSQRLLGTPGYATIASRFYNSYRSSLAEPQNAFALFRKIQLGNVRSTWELYEIWCLVRIYSFFVTKLGFKTNGTYLFDELTVRRGELYIPRNTEFGLVLKVEDGPELKAVFYYELELFKDGGFNKPDIFIELVVAGEKLSFALDAKYRDYSMQGVSQIVEDVEGCAQNKYRIPHELDGSFILHTDERFDYWGEMPLAVQIEKIYRSAVDAHKGQQTYVGHRQGAIRLRPGRNPDKQIRKLASLMLQYHGRLVGICIHCVRRLKPENGEIQLQPTGKSNNVKNETPTVQTNSRKDRIELVEGLISLGKYVGERVQPLYFLCDSCARLWVVQHCGQRDHLILKAGDLTLHERMPNQGWWYVCPTCGEQGNPNYTAKNASF